MSSGPICPLTPRRTATEALIRYLAVQLTVLPLYDHLLSLRNVRSPVERALYLLAYALNPLFPAFLALRYPLLTLATFLFRRTLAPLWKATSIRDKVKVLISASVGAHIALCEIGGDEASSESVERAFTEEWWERWREVQVVSARRARGSWYSKIPWSARLVIMVLVTVQCVGSVLLGLRRHHRDSNTRFDDWCLAMAISGLVVLLQSVVLIVLDQTWKLEPESMSKYAFETQGNWRGTGAGLRLKIVAYILDIMVFVGSLVLALILWRWHGTAGGHLLSGFYTIIGMLCAYVGHLCWGKQPEDRPKRFVLWLRLIGIVMVVGCILCVFSLVSLHLDDIARQLGVYQQVWPQNQPCPQLWKDGLAGGLLPF